MDDELLWGIGILLALRALGEWDNKVVPALQQQGAKIYDTLHDDAGHKKDLPGKQMTKKAVEALAVHMGFPDPHLAMAIAFAESGGVPNAILRNDREYSVGLWQINTRAWPQWSPEELKDPRRNAEAAFAISKGGTNWNPWSTFKNGTYQRYL